jgi:hypothetical protein
MSNCWPVLSANIAHKLGAMILVAVRIAKISPNSSELKPLPSKNTER